MRETKFIEQNQEKWAEFEDLLQQQHRDPAKLNDLFIQITDDLSYARTFYPHRSVRMYLNGLAQRIFHNVYRGKQIPQGWVRRFWGEELPNLMWVCRKALWVAFALFVLSFAIGVVSSMINPDFANVVLGPNYVAMTEQNINNGDPMAVYKKQGPLGMTNYIAANNLQVAFFTTLLGVVASIGTVFILIKNGVMVGVFQYFFISKGLFWPSFLTIWIHGTLEISAIIIAGAAGLVAGSGLLFPGTHTRVQAFQISVRRGLKIFLGVAPIILLAAFFEGFLTRYTDTPDAVRLMFILASLGFVLWYFVWLPWHKAKGAGFKMPLQDKTLTPDRSQAIDFYSIKTSGEVLADAFTVLRRHPVTVLLGLVGTTVVFTITAFLSSEEEVLKTFTYEQEWLGVLRGSAGFFSNDPVPFLLFFHMVLLGGLGMAVFRAVEQEMDIAKYPLFSLRQMVLRGLVLVLPVLGVVFLQWAGGGGWAWMGAMFFSPFCAFWAAAIYFETINPFIALGRSVSMYRWGIGLGLGFLTVNLSILLFTFLDFPVWRIVMEFFSWLIPSSTDSGRIFYTVFTTLVAAAITYFIFMVAMLCGAMQYFSDREAHDADHLQEGIAHIGKSKRIRGLLRE